MVSEAEKYLHDAGLLENSFAARSSAASLFKVLALEILLKAAGLAYIGRYSRTHNYVALWDDLPAQVRDDILAIGATRFAGHTDLSDVKMLLRNYELVFTKVRYHYELYEGYSLAEQKQLGDYWIELGAPKNESIVNFHPMELSAILYGLQQVITNAP